MSRACHHCAAELADDARFCDQCGQSVVPLCPTCGAETASGARFCSSCGTALETKAPSVGQEARKIVSVLFADVVGFTEHTERSDPEDVRARLTVFHRQMREDVERHGGRIEKLIGDGVFAVFGAPIAHEDDPERAVRSALRAQESIVGLKSASLDMKGFWQSATSQAVDPQSFPALGTANADPSAWTNSRGAPNGTQSGRCNQIGRLSAPRSPT